MTDLSKPRVLLVCAEFYADLADIMAAQAREVLEKAGVFVEIVNVPGAFEIPGAIAMATQSRTSYDGYVALGCVIRGETSHYEYVCTESARGLMDLAVRDKLALGYGILTVETYEQALIRAEGKNGNLGKGTDAAFACLTMMDLKERFSEA